MLHITKDTGLDYNSSKQSPRAYAIEVDHLSKSFKGKLEDVKAVNQISFGIERGEIFGLLGPNGAGKSTLISMLTGILSPTSGNAYIGGHSIIDDLQPVKEMMSVCPQEPALYKFLSGMANIEFFGKMYLMSDEQITRRAEELLRQLGLFDFKDRLVRAYSGGMLRQLSLIVSLISDPDILFLDEPTVGMDPRNRRKVWDFLGNINSPEKTIILTTHYIEEAEALCNRVAIIDFGELLALASPAELIKKYDVDNLEDVFMEITGRSIMEGSY